MQTTPTDILFNSLQSVVTTRLMYKFVKWEAENALLVATPSDFAV